MLSEADARPEHLVCSEADLAARRGRLAAQVDGRYLAIIAHEDEVYAIDSTCYHMGGPLLHADIEDCGDFGPAVVCPWHRYQICLRSGDSLYQNMQGKVCTKGVKQRSHAVARRDGQVFVRLDAAAGEPGGAKVESDTYAFKPPPPSGGGQQQPPPRRSGDVMRQQGAAGSRQLSGGGRGRPGAHPVLHAGGAAGAAGVRRAPPPAGVMGDVAKSMSGADGRAPWARATPPPPPPGCASFSAARGAPLGSMAPPAAVRAPAPPGAAGAADAAGWEPCTVASVAPAGRDSVRLTVHGRLPGAAATWNTGAHVMVRLVGGSDERPYTPYLRSPADQGGPTPRPRRQVEPRARLPACVPPSRLASLVPVAA